MLALDVLQLLQVTNVFLFYLPETLPHLLHLLVQPLVVLLYAQKLLLSPLPIPFQLLLPPLLTLQLLFQPSYLLHFSPVLIVGAFVGYAPLHLF